MKKNEPNNTVANTEAAKTNQFSKIQNFINNKTNPNANAINFYTIDMANGKGAAVVRILPTNPDGLPFWEYRRHQFTKNGVEFKHVCPKVYKEKCEICENSKKIWNTDQDLYRSVKARTSYVVYVKVIVDKVHPDLVGQIRPMVIPNEAFQNILKRFMGDAELGIEPSNIFDWEEGSNIQITISKNGDFNKWELNVLSKSKMEPLDLTEYNPEEVIKYEKLNAEEFAVEYHNVLDGKQTAQKAPVVANVDSSELDDIIG